VNLEPLGPADTDAGSSGSSPFGSVPGFGGNIPQMQEAQRQAQVLLQHFQTILPPGVGLQQALGGMAVFVLFFVYRLGFLFGLPASLFTIGSVILAFPSYKSAGGGVEGLKAGVQSLSQRLSAQLSQQTGREISEKHAIVALGLLYAWTLFLLLSPLFAGSASAAASAAYPDTAAAYTSQSSERAHVHAFEAFKQGYEAGKRGDAYQNPFEEDTGGVNLEPEDIYSNMDNVQSRRSSRSSLPGLDKLLPLILVGKTVYDMGGKPWNQQTFMANLQQAEMWKKALMGIAVMRLFM